MSGPILFGIRHLSPAAAYQLRRALDAAKPELVLVEGPSDLSGQMKWLYHSEAQFPVAILAYTRTPPVRTILYPFAIYSPEIQAILWAHEHKVPCRFMDLPSSVLLGMRPWFTPLPEKEDAEEGEGEAAEEPQSEEPAQTTESVYKRLETLTGEDHDTFWERTFEQLEGDDFRVDI